MTDWVAIASGKGGAGKTTIAVNLATSLAIEKKKVVLLDCNLHSPNIALHLGSSELPVGLHHVIRGESSLEDAIYDHPSGLKVIPGVISYSMARTTPFSELDLALAGLPKHGDIIIMDMPEGLGDNVRAALQLASNVIIITTPDLPSVVGSLKFVHLASEMGKEINGIIVNKWHGDSYDLSPENISQILDLPVLALVPFHEATRRALKAGHPVVSASPSSSIAQSFRNLVKQIQEGSMPPIDERTKSWVNRNV